MKIIKKVLCIICVAAIILSLSIVATSALTVYDGDFGYEIDTYFHTASLVEYIGNNPIVTIPEYYRTFPVTTIENTAFSRNTLVEQINIPDTVTVIKNDAFAYCTSLKEITIPATVTGIGTGICMGCTDLESVVYNAENTIPSSTFSGCSSLTSVTLSEKCKEIGEGAFSRCSSLTDISFINGIESINDSAFFKTGLSEVTVSENITSIPYYAFAYINTLGKILIPKSVTYIDEEAFEGSENVVIYCYRNSYAHQYAEKNVIEYVLLDPITYILGDVDGDDSVQIIDVAWIQRTQAQMEIPIAHDTLMQGDVDEDGDLTLVDATMIQRFLCMSSTPYNIGKYVSK